MALFIWAVLLWPSGSPLWNAGSLVAGRELSCNPWDGVPWTQVLCVGRSLSHWTTREVPVESFSMALLWPPLLPSFSVFKDLCDYIWRRQWQPTPVLLPRESHGWRSLVGCSPWGHKESETTEWLHFHFSLSCIGEGNGNPLQCSCLENPRDGEPGVLASVGLYRVGHDWSA